MSVLREVKLSQRLYRSITAPTVLKNDQGKIEILIPMRERMRTVSFRAPESAIYSIDKTMVITQLKTSARVTRTQLIERVVEALAFLFESMDYDVDRIKVTCENSKVELTVVINLVQEW